MTYAFYGMLLGAYLLALLRPVWGLVAVVVVELSLDGYIPGTGLSVRLGSAMVSGFLALRMIVDLIRSVDGRFNLLFVPALVLLAMSTSVNLAYSDFGYVFKYFRWQVVQLIALVLAASVIRDRRDVKIVVGVALAVAVISALLAIVQHVSPHPLLYNGMTPEQIAGWNGRAVGLVKSPVLLANHLTFVLLPTFGLLVCTARRMDAWWTAMFGMIMIILSGLYVTFTRSALISVGPGLLFLAVYARGVRRAALIGAVLAMPILYVVLQGTGLIGERYYEDASSDKSAAGHLGMLEVGVEVALDNWLVGIGHEWFEEESTAYLDVVSSEVVQTGASKSIGEGRVHNDYLNVWFSWGIAAIIAYLALLIGSLLNFSAAARSRDSLIRGLAAGCASGMVTYAVNSAFHNYLDSSVVLWLYAGLSVTLVKMARDVPIAERRQRLARLRYPRLSLRPALRA